MFDVLVYWELNLSSFPHSLFLVVLVDVDVFHDGAHLSVNPSIETTDLGSRIGIANKTAYEGSVKGSHSKVTKDQSVLVSS